MALKEILLFPHPKLLEVCQQVGNGLAGLDQLVQEMSQAMFAANGAGLAAPQVGEIKRLFIIDPVVAGLSEKDPAVTFIDPEILEFSAKTEIGDEGCLSFPGIYVPVKRSLSVRARARDLNGDSFEVRAEGLYARAIQHETDHLDGKLLIHLVGRLKRQMIKRRMQREVEEEASP